MPRWGATVSTSDEGKVLVSDILENSDVYRRGLRDDDEIVRFAGREIRTTNAFKNILGIFPKGWRVALSYRRDGKTTEILVRLRGVHHEEELIAAAEESEEEPKMIPLKDDRPAPEKKPDDKQPDKPKAEKPGEKPADKPSDKTSDKPGEKPRADVPQG